MEILHTLSPSGDRQFRFAGADAWRVKTVGDYIVSLEWFGPKAKKVDACVVIWPASQSFDAGAWVISRRRIGAYSDPNNRPLPYAFDEAFEALKLMGRVPLNMEVRKLVGLLMDQVDDLVRMPTAPTFVKRRIGGEAMFDVTVSDKLTGKVLKEVSI